MKKSVKQISMFFFVLFLITSVSGQVFAMTTQDIDSQVELSNEPHYYEVSMDSPEWAEMDLEQRLAVCSVSADEVECMTTEALIETVLNYPFLVNIFAYESLEEGIVTVCSYFPGLSELLSRENAVAELSDYLSNTTVPMTTNDEISFATISAVELLKYCEEVASKNSSADVRSVPATVRVYTPNRTPVQAFIDLTWEDHGTTKQYEQSLLLQYLRAYPDCELVEGVNPNYNCHSYAFCNQYPTNRYWINDPIAYITDGSYTRTVGDGRGGLRVVYTKGGSRIHSAITVYSVPRIMVISKWGENGLFKHGVGDCPYGIGATYTYYERP